MEQNSQSISIMRRIRSIWVLLEGFIIEVGDVCALSELLLDFFIKGNGLTDFGYAAFNVDVLDMKTSVERLDGRILNGLERLHHGVEEELNLVLLELDAGSFKALDVVLECAVVRVR